MKTCKAKNEGVEKMTRPTYKNIKEKVLSNPEVKSEYDSLEPVYELRRKLIEMRTQKGVSQNELAKEASARIICNQAHIN